MKKILKALKKATKIAKAANKAKSEFLANMSHGKPFPLVISDCNMPDFDGATLEKKFAKLHCITIVSLLC